MKTAFDMEKIRTINLFRKITGVSANNCFNYKLQVVFSVKPVLISKAIGRNGENVRRLSRIMGKGVRVIAYPNKINDFIKDIVYPTEFKDIKVGGDMVTISATNQNKAILIGRNSRRLIELQNILGEYFGVKKVCVI